MNKKLPAISVILYKSKTLANGEHPILLRICYNGKRKYKSLGLSCSAKDWNDAKEEVRGQNPLAKNINTLIRSEKTSAVQLVLKLESSGAEYSAQSILKALSRPSSSTTVTLYSLFQDRIDYNWKINAHNTSTGYKTLLNRIKKYTDNEDLDLVEVTPDWITEFEIYLRGIYKDTSIKKFFDCLVAAFNYAVRQNFISKSPLDGYQHVKKLDVKTKKRALTIAEITTLIQYYFDTYIKSSEKPNLEVTTKHYWNRKFQRRGVTKLATIDAEQFSLAMFLCSYYMQGLAMVDMAKLRWKDIKDLKIVDREQYAIDCAEHGTQYANQHKVVKDYYEINVSRAKTNHPVRIVVDVYDIFWYLMPFTSALKGMDEETQEETYVFPIYGPTDDTEEKRYGRRNYATYLINNNIKRVGERLGINGITFYSARHTYASMLYHANVPIGLIAQNMGRNIADIETYLKDFDTDGIIQANAKLNITEDPAFQSAKKNRPVSEEKRAAFQVLSERREETEAAAKEFEEKHGKPYSVWIREEMEHREKFLDERFGNDLSAKIEYLKEQLNRQ